METILHNKQWRLIQKENLFLLKFDIATFNILKRQRPNNNQWACSHKFNTLQDQSQAILQKRKTYQLNTNKYSNLSAFQRILNNTLQHTKANNSLQTLGLALKVSLMKISYNNITKYATKRKNQSHLKVIFPKIIFRVLY